MIGLLLLTVTAASAQAPEAVATVKQLMGHLVSPGSMALSAAAANPPSTDEAWGRVANQAMVLAESANLLMIGARARDRAAWMEMAAGLRTAAAAAMTAASARNVRGLRSASVQIEESCSQCHAAYIRKGALRVRPPSSR